MKGRRIMNLLSYINPAYINEAEFDSLSEGGKELTPHRKRPPKLLLIAAIIAAMLLLMGAAIYTRWTLSMQNYYNPSESAKQQAKKSGLSVMYEKSKPDDGSVLTATDQGITVSLVQSIVDQSRAQIVLRVEGFTPPEDYMIHPEVWMEVPATLDGNEHFWGSAGEKFDDGIIKNNDGEYVYRDGTPVEENPEGFWKGRYIKDDGSMELVISYHFQDTSGANLGKEFQLHLTGFGIRTDVGKADTTYEKLVDGRWDLRWILKGSDDAIKIEPNVRLSDDVTLIQAEIGQLTVKTLYRTDTYWDGWKNLESLTPGLAGIKLKDGTLIQCYSGSEGYQDQENLIYFVESHTFQGMVDMDQVEALAFYDGWEKDGASTIPVYKFIPVQK